MTYWRWKCCCNYSRSKFSHKAFTDPLWAKILTLPFKIWRSSRCKNQIVFDLCNLKDPSAIFIPAEYQKYCTFNHPYPKIVEIK